MPHMDIIARDRSFYKCRTVFREMVFTIAKYIRRTYDSPVEQYPFRNLKNG